MGVLVDVKSESSFVLQREDFARALRGLKRLAKEQPAELESPEQLARAKTLADALDCTYWAPRFDAFGDLVAINYQVDKAPRDASDFWPASILEVLAKAGGRGWVRYSADEYECVFNLDHDGVYRQDSASAFGLAVELPDRATPGESVILKIKAGERIADAPLVVKVHADWTLEGRASGITVRFDPEPMREAEVRPLTLELDARARGGIDLVISAGEACTYCSLAVDPSPEELAKPWEVIDRRSVADRSAIVPKGAIKKTLERLRRFAVRNCERPGAEFLREIAEAESLDAALALAGLELRAAERRQQELAFTADRLPGAERYFTQLLDLLAKPAGRHCRISLSLAFAHSPELWREYRVWHGDIRCSVSRRTV